ncbi:MAG: hemerythrin domain-containing protein [Bacteroidales bacterium]|nr:hemerythrin domain-containing protein [Bacteroidales bacterium]
MNNKETIYNNRMKLAELLASDISLLSILQRLDIRLGFGEATVKDICNRYGISDKLFLMICNIYSFRDYQPEVEALAEKDIRSIITYLHASHRFYRQVYFPAIHDSIHSLVKELDEVNRKLIDKFYDDYDKEVNNHFDYEEHTVFPYIESLLSNKAEAGIKYNIRQFEHNHSNIGEKLSDLKNIITKYLPEKHSSTLMFNILGDIYNIENDLRKHSLIENKLLVPLVEKLEMSHE